MLETSILDQVRSIFQQLEARYTFHITYHPKHEQEMCIRDRMKPLGIKSSVAVWSLRQKFA